MKAEVKKMINRYAEKERRKQLGELAPLEDSDPRKSDREKRGLTAGMDEASPKLSSERGLQLNCFS